MYGVITELKVESVKSQKGEDVKIATGKLADETGCIEFKLRNEHVENLKEKKVVAFRNGKSILDDECIHLELDKFGKVTEEPDVKINAKNTPNHSEQKWEKKQKN